MRKMLLSVSALFTFLTGIGYADPILTRSDLLNQLGSGAVTETFESYSISPGMAAMLDTATLDSSTIVNGQGPGLVSPGVSFKTAGELTNYGNVLQLNAPGYYGASSNELLSDTTGINIAFSAPVNAFGLDLRDFSGYTSSTDIYVYDSSGNLVYSTSNMGLDGNPMFWGYGYYLGISKVVLLSPESAWSPIIDNVTFGSSSVPEPTSIFLLGTGLVVIGLPAWYRKKD